MIEIEIPGFKRLALAHLVLDYNGTLALDGVPLAGVRHKLSALANALDIHVVTADTFGKVQSALADLPCNISILPIEAQDQGKLNYIHQLGAHHTCAVGNGRNDQLMLQAASLGICVMLAEGASVETLTAADVVCRDIIEALDLLCNPLRLTATLRS
jgi:soluble P-type ATPase